MPGTTFFDVTQTTKAMMNTVSANQEVQKNNKPEFSDVLSVASQKTSQRGRETSSDVNIANEDAKPATDAYDRYQYKDNTVDNEQATAISDKIESAKDDIEKIEENVITQIAEQLEVEPAEVEKVLEELGLSAFDLLNPQNLAQVVIGLTDANDSMELLLDGNFQKLLVQVGEAGSDIMNQLNLQMNEMDEFVSQMNVLEQPEYMQENPVPGSDALIQEAAIEAAGDFEGDLSQDFIVENGRTDVVNEQMTQTKSQDAGMSGGGSQHEGQDSFDHDSFIHANIQGEALQNEKVPGDVQAPQMSYSDTLDAIDLINQVAERAKLTLSDDVTTMEMQLNPENLGKIYLQVSTKEGNVNAQIAAQNETVKEALEMQLAAMREQLNQAGIKVDEIEVTVATHEFERNLEQNQNQNFNQQEESAKDYQDGEVKNRRNLRMDSLDELSGLMTEEEQLVAQIMKDNGNSVDFKA